MQKRNKGVRGLGEMLWLGLGWGELREPRTVAQCGNGMIQIIVLLIMFCFFQAVKIYVMMV